MKKLFLFISILALSLICVSQNIEISSEKVLIDGEKYYIHNIKQGQTLYSISQAYKVSVDELVRINPEAENGVQIGQAIKIPIVENIDSASTTQKPDTQNIEGIEHIVQRGETIFGICKMYNLSTEALYKANPEVEDKGLKAGDILIIPESDLSEAKSVQTDDIDIEENTDLYIIHRVKRGETLYSLAKQYNISESEILNSNNELEATKLKLGQNIRIPRKVESKIQFPKHEEEVKAEEKEEVQDIDLSSSTSDDNESIYKEIRDDLKPKSEITITILLPFEVYSNTKNWYNQSKAKKEYTNTTVSRMMVEYYYGCLMAFDILKSFNFKVQLNVYDIGTDTVELSNLASRGVFSNTDVLIGPAFSKQVNYVKNYLSSKTVLISPFANYEKVNISNTYSIWTSLGKISRIATFTDFALSNPKYQFVIIHTNTDESKSEANEIISMINTTSKDKNIQTPIVSSIGYTEANEANLAKLMSKTEHNIVISLTNTEMQASATMVKLMKMEDFDIRLIGDISWLEYKTIDASYYNGLKFSYLSPTYINYQNEETQVFIKNYRYQFNDEPSTHSFAAYDLMQFFLSNYEEHGLEWINYENTQLKTNSLASNFEFSKHFYTYKLVPKHAYIIGFDEDFSTILLHPPK